MTLQRRQFVIGGLGCAIAAVGVDAAPAAGGPYFHGKTRFADGRTLRARTRVDVRFYWQGTKRPFWSNVFVVKDDTTEVPFVAALNAIPERPDAKFQIKVRASHKNRLIGAGETSIDARGERDFTIILQPEGDSQNG